LSSKYGKLEGRNFEAKLLKIKEAGAYELEGKILEM